MVHFSRIWDTEYNLGLIDWVEVLHPIMLASGYVRCGYEVGCLWLLLLEPNTGGN